MGGHVDVEQAMERVLGGGHGLKAGRECGQERMERRLLGYSVVTSRPVHGHSPSAGGTRYRPEVLPESIGAARSMMDVQLTRHIQAVPFSSGRIALSRHAHSVLYRTACAIVWLVRHIACIALRPATTQTDSLPSHPRHISVAHPRTRKLVNDHVSVDTPEPCNHVGLIHSANRCPSPSYEFGDVNSRCSGRSAAIICPAMRFGGSAGCQAFVSADVECPTRERVGFPSQPLTCTCICIPYHVPIFRR